MKIRIEHIHVDFQFEF